jgi:hypothetical protein
MPNCIRKKEDSSQLPQHIIKAFDNMQMDANEVKGDNHE